MRAGAVFGFRGLCIGLLAACITSQYATAADDTPIAAAPHPGRAVFERERASQDVRYVADWIVDSGDNRAGDDHGNGGARLPFVILDKKDARIYVFHEDGRLSGAAAALLGLGRGDTALPDIGAMELSNIAPKDRITPAGRFVAEIGADSHGEDVLWVDYKGGVAIHRVITTNPREHRLQRLNSPTSLDNRISWGCINIPAKFYEKVVQPAFAGTKGIVYVLPETKPVDKVFASYDVNDRAKTQMAILSKGALAGSLTGNDAGGR